VTKGSGKVGDVSEKLEAARLEGCRAVVVHRPEPSAEYFDQVGPLIKVLPEGLTPWPGGSVPFIRKAIKMNKPGISDSVRNLIGFAGRQGSSMGYAWFVVAMTAVMAFGVWQSSAAEARSSAGTASGALTINGKGIPLQYSYAMAQPNTFDAAKNDLAILLTEKPLAEEALSGIGDLRDATRKQQGWAFFKINSDGKPIYELIDHPATKEGKYGQIQMSGFTHASFVPRSMGKDRVEGSFATSKPEDFMGYKYEIKAEFSTPLLKAKLPEPLPEAKTGKTLPLDGGEPGKVYKAHRQAIKDKDIAALRQTAPDALGKDRSDSDLEKMLDFMNTIAPGAPKITRGYVKGDRAVLYVEGFLEGKKQYGTVELAAKGKTWYIVNESWSNTPPKK